VRALATMLLVAAAFSFGCGGRVQAEPAGTDRGRTQHFTLSDAGSIASAGPAASAWTWLAKPAPPEQGEIRSQDPLIVALRRRLGRLTSKGDADHKWIDHDKLAHLGVGVYPNSREAHDALEALDAFALGSRAGCCRSRGTRTSRASGTRRTSSSPVGPRDPRRPTTGAARICSWRLTCSASARAQGKSRPLHGGGPKRSTRRLRARDGAPKVGGRGAPVRARRARLGEGEEPGVLAARRGAQTRCPVAR